MSQARPRLHGIVGNVATVDLVLSFFATPGATQAPADVVQPVGLFRDTTLVASGWPMGPGEHTARFKPVGEMRNPVTKRLLPNLIASARRQLRLDADTTIRRVAAVGFSAGRWCLSELLRHPDDRAALDAVIDLDGMNIQKLATGAIDPGQGLTASGYYAGSPGLGAWVDYGRLALDGKRLLVNCHTDIAAPGSFATSTSEACAALYDALAKSVDAGAAAASQPFNADELYAGPPPPMVRTPAQAGDKAREWELMPPLELTTIGNCHKVHLEGNQAGYHIFACYWLQAAVWRTFLVPRWSDPEQYTCTGVSGLGAWPALGAASCAPKTTSMPAWLVADDVAQDPRWKTGEMEAILAMSENGLAKDGLVDTLSSIVFLLVGGAIGFWAVTTYLESEP